VEDKTMNEIKNISAIVVQTRPEYLSQVLEDLEKSGVCDIHFYDEKGRIIVTVEGKDADEEISKIKKIESIPHVVSAEMHFTYTAEELDQALKKIEENQQKIIEFLNDDSIPAEKINYSGHMYKKY
jgi:nitrate reductase NapD